MSYLEIEVVSAFQAGVLRSKVAASTSRDTEMSETEKLLHSATEIAKRTFESPSELAVLKIFERLTYEHDCSVGLEAGGGSATRH